MGCSACNNGYKGRVGIYQVMPISEDMQRIILADGSALEIAKQAKAEGVRSLRESGLHKVKLGLTSLEEVLAVHQRIKESGSKRSPTWPRQQPRSPSSSSNGKAGTATASRCAARRAPRARTR